jgi:flagellar biosynthesis protein FliQ
MVNYLLTNAFWLFVKLAFPVWLGAFLGGLVATLIQGFLSSDDKSFGFFGRFAGGLLGVFFSLQLLSSTLVQYAQRIWGGLDLYR